MIEIKAEDYKKEVATIQASECEIKLQKAYILENVLNRLGLDKEVYLKENDENYIKGRFQINKKNSEIEFFKGTNIKEKLLPYAHYKVFVGYSFQTDLDHIVEFLQYKFIPAEELKEKVNDE